MRKISKKTLVIIVIVAILGIGGIAFAYKKNNQQTDTINYSPPTAEEKKAGDEQKEKNLQRESESNKDNESENAVKNANLVVVDASQYDSTIEVRGYVSNLIEQGGTCTAIFTKDGKTLQYNSSAFKDASTTQCGALDAPRSDFSSTGEWNLTLKYTSESAKGEVSNIKVAVK